MTHLRLSSLWQPRVVVPIFFLALVVVGLIGYESVGLSWDENNQVAVGESALDYVLGRAPWPEDHDLRYYGPAFELVLTVARRAVGTEDARTVFLLRHFLTFQMFIVGVAFFYLLARRLFRDWRLALLGSLFLVLSPRIFGEAFYNSKDIPSLAFFIISMYTLVMFLDRRTAKRAMLHGLACGLVMSVRLTGIFVPALTAAFLAREVIALRPLTRPAALFAMTFALSALLFWPFLWTHPITHFLEAYRWNKSQGSQGIYFGHPMSSLPWHYVFVWIGITTPPLYTALFIAGLFFILFQFFRDPLHGILREYENAAILLWFFLPILSVYIAGAGLFDGWRHMYFIYPAFLLITLRGLQFLFSIAGRYLRGALIGIISFSSLVTSGWMLQHHPLTNVYFSVPAPLVWGNFPVDYWGLSYRKGIEYVLHRDPRPMITVFAMSSPGYWAQLILRKEDNDQLRYLPINKAMYFITNYREDFDKDYHLPEVYRIEIDGLKVLSVFKLR